MEVDVGVTVGVRVGVAVGVWVGDGVAAAVVVGVGVSSPLRGAPACAVSPWAAVGAIELAESSPTHTSASAQKSTVLRELNRFSLIVHSLQAVRFGCAS